MSTIENHHRHGTDVAVIIVPFLAQSHLHQHLLLARHLATTFRLPVHYVGSTLHNRQARQRLLSLDPPISNSVPEKTPVNADSEFRDPPHLANGITFHGFNLPNLNSTNPKPNPNLNFPAHLQPAFCSTHHLRRPFFDLLNSISKRFRRVIVIHDGLMASVVQDVKSMENVESYELCTASAFTLLMFRYESMKEKPFEIEQIGVSSEIEIPSYEGCFTEEFAKFAENESKILNFSCGSIYHTNRMIERRFLDLIDKLPINAGQRQFVVGPLQPMVIKERSTSAVIEWLEKQGADSVLYVSFGTTTSFRKEQITEIAIGLERSQHKFVWVLRDADRADIFSQEETRRIELPEGYEDWIQERGIIVRDWAPQLEILAHPAIGGFMSHCGWGSCLESLSMGVPMLTWPVHSDQPKNAFLVTHVLKTGIIVRDWKHRDKLVTVSDIEIAVKRLMGSQEGDDIRKRVVQLGCELRDSVAEGGASRLEMESFVAHITR